MYYDPDKNDHGLAHNPFKSCTVPRPIGWISTISIRPLARLGYYDYTSVESVFEMVIPTEDDALLVGLEGAVK